MKTIEGATTIKRSRPKKTWQRSVTVNLKKNEARDRIEWRFANPDQTTRNVE